MLLDFYVLPKLTASLSLPINCEHFLSILLEVTEAFWSVFYAYKRLWVDVFKVKTAALGPQNSFLKVLLVRNFIEGSKSFDLIFYIRHITSNKF